MDTTAKVDIRKLQLLNDRIAQTIEALNQVRLSVHGLGFAQPPGVGMPGYVPQYPAAFQSPWQTQGILHSSPYAQQNPLVHMLAQNPMLASVLGQQAFAQPGVAYGGLSHTSPEAIYAQGAWGQPHSAIGQGVFGQWLDPITQARVMQSFPFAQMPISPVQ
jgi:hypothetical protein